MKSVLIDSGFWIALFDPADDPLRRSDALALTELIENQSIIIPWPTLYEFVNTRLARRREHLIHFENFLKKPNVGFLDDSDYRENALEKTFENNRIGGLRLSLVDQILFEIIVDENLKIDYFISFNKRDFAHVCASRKIETLL